jgi:hypothetical protein
MIKNVAFFGFADTKATDEEYAEVVQVARLLAENGYTIVDGGGPGVMEAATVGAHKGGGRAIGVILLNRSGLTTFEGPSRKNNFDEEITTNSYVERTVKLIELGDAYIVFNGGTGTISEFGMVWGLARLNYGHHKPFILFGSWWHEIMEAFATYMHIRPEELLVYRIVTTPGEVIDVLEKIDSRN